MWVSQDMWPDDAATIRKLGLGSRPRAGRGSSEPADDHGPGSGAESIGILGPALKALDWETQDAVIDAYTQAKQALAVDGKSDGPNEPGLVASAPRQPDGRGPQDSQPPERRRAAISFADIFELLEPEYHDALHQAIADEKRALARLLDRVPWPRPSYAGIQAEHVAILVRTCTGETLKALAEPANSRTASEHHKARSRACERAA